MLDFILLCNILYCYDFACNYFDSSICLPAVFYVTHNPFYSISRLHRVTIVFLVCARPPSYRVTGVCNRGTVPFRPALSPWPFPRLYHTLSYVPNNLYPPLLWPTLRPDFLRPEVTYFLDCLVVILLSRLVRNQLLLTFLGLKAWLLFSTTPSCTYIVT